MIVDIIFTISQLVHSYIEPLHSHLVPILAITIDASFRVLKWKTVLFL